MGVTNSPEFAQGIMESIFRDVLGDIEVFIDDITLFDNDFDSHLAKKLTGLVIGSLLMAFDHGVRRLILF